MPRENILTLTVVTVVSCSFRWSAFTWSPIFVSSSSPIRNVVLLTFFLLKLINRSKRTTLASRTARNYRECVRVRSMKLDGARWNRQNNEYINHFQETGRPRNFEGFQIVQRQAEILHRQHRERCNEIQPPNQLAIVVEFKPAAEDQVQQEEHEGRYAHETEDFQYSIVCSHMRETTSRLPHVQMPTAEVHTRCRCTSTQVNNEKKHHATVSTR